MRILKAIEKTFKLILPSPFSIALILTIVSFLLAFFLTESPLSNLDRVIEIARFWENGLWNSPLLVFAVQMMLMLVLGHTLALTPPVSKIIELVDVILVLSLPSPIMVAKGGTFITEDIVYSPAGMSSATLL